MSDCGELLPFSIVESSHSDDALALADPLIYQPPPPPPPPQAVAGKAGIICSGAACGSL